MGRKQTQPPSGIVPGRWKTPQMFPLVLVISALVFFHRLGEAPLKFDGLTYSALAKHIVESGVWTRLHYTSSAYDAFYPQPPLFIWMQAILFHVLPMTDATARLLPGLFGVASLSLLFAWTRALANAWAGLLAVLFLLIAYPYVKYASDAYMEGPLVFFTLLGLWGYARAIEREKNAASVLVFGASVFCALMTKGVVGLSLPAAAGVYPIVRRLPFKEVKRCFSVWLLGMAVAAAFASVWLFWGDGFHYVSRYWEESVAGRSVARDWSSRFQFFVYLFWRSAPAAVIFSVSLGVLFRQGKRLPAAVVLCLLQSAFVALGFSFSGQMHEHYLITFFPTAALVVGYVWRDFGSRFEFVAARALGVLCLILSLWLACYPSRVRTLREEPARLAAFWVREHCNTTQLQKVYFTPEVTEKWLGLANLLWYLPGDAFCVPENGLLPPLSQNELLILPPEQKAPLRWERASITPWVKSVPETFVVYQPIGSALCLQAAKD